MLNYIIVKSGVLTAVVTNVAIIWDIAPCSTYVTDVSEECITSIFWGENHVPINRRYMPEDDNIYNTVTFRWVLTSNFVMLIAIPHLYSLPPEILT
jgi:hypothetical protein